MGGNGSLDEAVVISLSGGMERSGRSGSGMEGEISFDQFASGDEEGFVVKGGHSYIIGGAE